MASASLRVAGAQALCSGPSWGVVCSLAPGPLVPAGLHTTWHPARRRDLGLTAPAQPWPWGSPTGPRWPGVQVAPLAWGLMPWGGGLRGGQGRTQGGPSGSQPAKAQDPEPHFHGNHLRVGSSCSLRLSRSGVPRWQPAPLTFLVFAQTQLRPPDSEQPLSSFQSLPPRLPGTCDAFTSLLFSLCLPDQNNSPWGLG